MLGMLFECACGTPLVILIPSRLIDDHLDPEAAREIDEDTVVEVLHRNVAHVAAVESDLAVDGRKAPVSCPNCGDPIVLQELAGLSELREAFHAIRQRFM
jgi:hypothetical protein